MALSALAIYRTSIAAQDFDIRPDVVNNEDFFDLPNLHEVADVEGSKSLNTPDRPSIIISAAGMASGGRVVHHLAHLLPEPRNTVILVGYQAAGTRGRLLMDGATEVKIHGQYVRVRAKVVALPMFSVHADSSELLSWVSQSSVEPACIYVVHGEPPASAALARSIERNLDWTAAVPHYLERVRIGGD